VLRCPPIRLELLIAERDRLTRAIEAFKADEEDQDAKEESLSEELGQEIAAVSFRLHWTCCVEQVFK
jgi:hypothetical protein